jgi:hypothetical protein
MPVAAVRALVRVDRNVVVLIELEDVFPVVVRRPGVALVAVAFPGSSAEDCHEHEKGSIDGTSAYKPSKDGK